MELENIPSLLAELVEGKALSAGWEGTVGTTLFSDSILPLAWATSGKLFQKLTYVTMIYSPLGHGFIQFFQVEILKMIFI